MHGNPEFPHFDDNTTPPDSMVELESSSLQVPVDEMLPKNNRTRHAQAEEALRDSETRYRRLFETAKDGILILDAASGQITDVNPFSNLVVRLYVQIING